MLLNLSSAYGDHFCVIYLPPMNNGVPKLWIFFFFFVLIGLVGVALSPTEPAMVDEEVLTESPDPARALTFDAMLETGNDAVYLEDQVAGGSKVVVGYVILSKPGYVVIHGDESGTPGARLGESKLLESGGEHVSIEVSEVLQDDAVYYAILYRDNGDGRFRSTSDAQVLDTKDSVVLMTFTASHGAMPELNPVSP